MTPHFWNLLKKVRQGLFSSFWSYEPQFRQEGGEGEAVTDGQMIEGINGIS